MCRKRVGIAARYVNVITVDGNNNYYFESIQFMITWTEYRKKATIDCRLFYFFFAFLLLVTWRAAELAIRPHVFSSEIPIDTQF